MLTNLRMTGGVTVLRKLIKAGLFWAWILFAQGFALVAGVAVGAALAAALKFF